jgi:hypothetical protein
LKEEKGLNLMFFSHILVRRTRNHVVKWYGYDEKYGYAGRACQFWDYLDVEKGLM